jgi:mono/diheme cytochrome c family protein
MSSRIRWILMPSVALAAVAGVLMLFTYEVIAIDFPVLMEDQRAVEYLDGPHLLAPEQAVAVSRPAYLAGAGTPENPVPADSVSVQRGEVLFSLHCALCHGENARGDGAVTAFWREGARRPPNLTEARINSLPDGAIYQFISQGIGGMPPLRHNLDERGRWDVINYLRSLQ